MNRRTVFVFGGFGIGSIGGYWGLNWFRSPTVPDGMTVDTRHFEKDILTEDSSRSSESLAWKQEYHTSIEDAETADRAISDADSSTSFIEDMDFEDSYLLVVQNGMQSDMELVLDAIYRRENGLRLEISIDSPMSGPDDLLTHSLLSRITDKKGKIPEEVTVDSDGYV